MNEFERRELTRKVAFATANLGRPLTFREKATLVRLVKSVMARQVEASIFSDGQSLLHALNTPWYRRLKRPNA